MHRRFIWLMTVSIGVLITPVYAAHLQELPRFFAKEGISIPQQRDTPENRAFADTFNQFLQSGGKEQLIRIQHAYCMVRIAVALFAISDNQLDLGISSSWCLNHDQVHDLMMLMMRDIFDYVVNNRLHIFPSSGGESGGQSPQRSIATYFKDRLFHHMHVLKVLPKFRTPAVTQSEKLHRLMFALRGKAANIIERLYALDELFANRKTDPIFNPRLQLSFRSTVWRYLEVQHHYVDFNNEKNSTSAREVQMRAGNLMQEMSAVGGGLGLLSRQNYTLRNFAEQKGLSDVDYAAFTFLLMHQSLNAFKMESEKLLNTQEQEESSRRGVQESLERARALGGEPTRIAAHDILEKLEGTSFSWLLTQADRDVALSQMLNTYRDLVSHYAKQGTLDGGELGQLMRINAFLGAKCDTLRNQGKRGLLGKPTEQEIQANQITELINVASRIRIKISRGQETIPEQDEEEYTFGIVNRVLELAEEIVRTQPELVASLRAVLNGNEGALQELTSKVKSVKNITYAAQLLELWNNIKASRSLSLLFNIMFRIFEERLDRIKKLASAFSSTPAEVSLPEADKAILRTLTIEAESLKGVSFVNAGELAHVQAVLRDRIPVGSIDPQFRRLVFLLSSVYSHAITEASRQLQNYKSQLSRVEQPPVHVPESMSVISRPIQALPPKRFRTTW